MTTPTPQQILALAEQAEQIYKGFELESLNGVVCSIPDEGLEAKPHRTWCRNCQKRYRELKALADTLRALAAAPSAGAGAQEASGPFPLNEAQERAAKEWAADDRLWTMQETVETNLRTFARVILKEASPPPPPPDTLDREALVKLENAIRAAWQAGWFAALGYEAGEHRDCELHVDSAIARLRAPTPTGETR